MQELLDVVFFFNAIKSSTKYRVYYIHVPEVDLMAQTPVSVAKLTAISKSSSSVKQP